MHQIDAFADAPFSGNPAAVMPLPAWLPDALLQHLAQENNLSETGFYTSHLPPEAGPPPGEWPAYHLRWFTPEVEIGLCGNATLAAAAQILTDIAPGHDRVSFFTRGGWLHVDHTDDDEYVLDLPVIGAAATTADPQLVAALGVHPVRCYSGTDTVVVVGSEQEVRAVRPLLNAFPLLPRAVIVTAPGIDVDFVARVFAPAIGIPEDPVSGSAYAQLVPLWSAELGRPELTARQLSQRGGRLRAELTDSRVLLTGRCRRYLDGVVTLP